jgi:lysine 2,3-aminomutase
VFIATSICPVYCRFCTRSYAVGGNTASTTKTPQKPSRKRWETLFEYIENTKSLKDIVVSGGDTYYLPPDEIKTIGERLVKRPWLTPEKILTVNRLLAMDHIRYVRFATKGLAVAPMRTIDPDDEWTRRFIELSKLGRRLGKEVCLHTHFNHPDEVSWITKEAARYLYEHGVIVRNQTVLLKGVNDEVETMRTLINMLGEAHIKPVSQMHHDPALDLARFCTVRHLQGHGSY